MGKWVCRRNAAGRIESAPVFCLEGPDPSHSDVPYVGEQILNLLTAHEVPLRETKSRYGLFLIGQRVGWLDILDERPTE